MVLIEHDWYFEESQTKFSDDYTERYYLTAVHENVNSKDILIAFLMNPSHAGRIQDKDSQIEYKFDSYTSDETVNLLLRTMGRSYGKVIVINNIPLIEPSSNKVKSIGCNSLTNNTEKITNIVKNKSYDLYVGVGVGAKGYSGNKFIKIAFTENMSFLSNRAHCMNIFVSGLNDGGSPKHPKGQGQGDDVSSLLLNLRRKVSWVKDEFYYLKGKAGDNRVQNSLITRKKLLID